MLINQEDNARLDAFIRESLEFLKNKATNKYYTSSFSGDKIELLDGTLIPAHEEDVFVLDNEFESFIIDQLVKFVEILTENVDNKLFGLAERTLYEYITGWLFLTVSGHIDDHAVRRLKALLFAGFYKGIDSSERDYIKYMGKRRSFLTEKDIDKLEQLNFTEFNDYIWSILNGIVSGYPIARKATIDKLGGAIQYKHQSMRIHANPTALAEMTGDIDRAGRHRLVMAFNLRQAVEYFRGDRDAERLMYMFDKFWKENNIREG